RDGGHRARRARRGGGQVHGPRRPPPDAARPPRLRLPPPERPATGPDPAAPALPGLVRAHRAGAVRLGRRRPHGLPGAPAAPRPRLRLRPAPGTGPGAGGVHRVLPRAAHHRGVRGGPWPVRPARPADRKSTRLNSSHVKITYAVSFLIIKT